jgi:hypothetical protein
MWLWAGMGWQEEDEWIRLPHENVRRLQNIVLVRKIPPPLRQFNVTLPQIFLGVTDRNDVYTWHIFYLSVLILSPIAPSSPHTLTRIILQSTLVAQDACVFSCATMVFIHIIQRPQRLFYY